MPPRRLVKKRSIWSNIVHAPQDWLMHIEEDYEALNWDKLQKIFSIPFGILVNVLYIITKINENNEWEEVKLDQNYSSLELLQFSLLFICVFNTIYLFTSKKQYQIRNADEKTPPASSHIKSVPITSFDDNDNNDEPENKTILSFIYSLLFIPFKKEDPNVPHIYLLTIWSPSPFSLNLFCLFSPAQVGILYLMDDNNWQYILFVSFILSLTMYCTSHSFISLMKDKQIIAEQVYNEYNLKFVNKIYVPTTNTSVETDSFINHDDDDESPFLESNTYRSNLFRRERPYKHPQNSMYSTTKSKLYS